MEFHQQAAGIPRKRTNSGSNSRLILDRTQSQPVHNLDGPSPMCIEHGNYRGHCVEIGEEKDTGIFQRKIRDCLQHRLCNEPQSALRPDQQMLQNINWTLEINEGVERISRSVFALVFGSNSLAKGRI